MKTKLLMVAGLVAVALAAWWMLRSETKTPTGPLEARPIETAKLKTVGVDAVAKDPKSNSGRIAIDGIVAQTFAKRGAFLMIDISEWQACGRTDCAEFSVPIHVPTGEFEGSVPRETERVLAIGDLAPTEAGYTFVIEQVQREGKVVLNRVKPPQEPAKEARTAPPRIADAMPATLIANAQALGLSEEQVKKLQAVNLRWDKVEKADRQKVEEEARAVLTPEQAKKLAECAKDCVD